MQKTVYKCDQCGREIGEKPHISLVLNINHDGCGIAVPPLKKGDKHSGRYSLWTTKRFDRSFIHFCNEEHLAKYFKKKLVAATKSIKK